MTWKRVITAPLFRIPATLLIDIVLVAACASILWNSGGGTVVNGSWVLQALCFLIATGLLAARHGLYIADRNTSGGFTSLRIERVIAGLDLVALVALIAVWIDTQRYYLGWVATFGALTLFLASMWQLLSALISRPTIASSRTRERARLSQSIAALSSLRALTCVLALVALAVLTEIHEWDAEILSGLIVLICGAILLAVVTRAWIVAITARPTAPSAMRRMEKRP